MEQRTTKVSYVRKMLEEKIVSGKSSETAKKEVRKQITDVLSILPHLIYTTLHDATCPEIIKKKRLLSAIMSWKSTEISMDTSYMFDITQEKLPPMQDVLKQDVFLCDRILDDVEEYEDMLSEYTMKHIRETVQEFLAKRREGIELFYRYHDRPHRLLDKLLSVYLPLNKDEWENEETLKGYLANKNMIINLDITYGAIYFFVAPKYAKQYNIPHAGKFRTQMFLDDMEMNTDDDNESDMNNDKTHEVYVIFGEWDKTLKTTIIHERQHLINHQLSDYYVDDYLTAGQNEIVAYMKQGMNIDDMKYVLINSGHYDYYDDVLNNEEKWIRNLEQRIADLEEREAPKIVITWQKKNLEKHKKEMEIYKNDHREMWEEYVANIESYIDVAYRIQKANIPNYITLLAITPIRAWKSLLNTYDIE